MVSATLQLRAVTLSENDIPSHALVEKATRMLGAHLQRNDYGVADIDTASMKLFDKVHVRSQATIEIWGLS